jgi:hypothetical protein
MMTMETALIIGNKAGWSCSLKTKVRCKDSVVLKLKPFVLL